MRRLMLVLVIFGAFYFGTFQLGGQDMSPKSPVEAELAAKKTAEADLAKRRNLPNGPLFERSISLSIPNL